MGISGSSGLRRKISRTLSFPELVPVCQYCPSFGRESGTLKVKSLEFSWFQGDVILLASLDTISLSSFFHSTLGHRL